MLASKFGAWATLATSGPTWHSPNSSSRRSRCVHLIACNLVYACYVCKQTKVELRRRWCIQTYSDRCTFRRGYWDVFFFYCVFIFHWSSIKWSIITPQASTNADSVPGSTCTMYSSSVPFAECMMLFLWSREILAISYAEKNEMADIRDEQQKLEGKRIPAPNRH